MSGGQCQRVMIAIAIACNPKLLIADEPTTALDVTIQKQILDLLVRLQAEYGMGLIMITHNMGVVAETADRVIVQYKGKKMEEADVLSLFEKPEEQLHARAALGAAGERDRRPAADHRPVPDGGRIGRREHADDGAAAMSVTVLEAKNIVRDYHVGGGLFSKPRTIHAVKGVSFSVEKGKTLAIVGESGLRKVDARPHRHADRPGDLRRSLHRRQQGRHRQGRPDAGNAPQGADRLPEPLRLAQPAPEDRRRARRAAEDQHRRQRRRSGASGR